MRQIRRPIGSVLASTFIASVLALSSNPASALTLTGISDASLASLTGAQVDTLTSAFDFAPTTAGGDGTVTSTVFEGAGDADGLFLYVYQIDLFDASTSSVSAISGIAFDFTTPAAIAFDGGTLKAFTVTDDGGSVGPLLASHTGNTARFFFIPEIGNDETSHQFGLISATAPGTAIATLLDSGAGLVLQPTLLSNGAAAPVPEPNAALLFVVGCVTLVGFGRRGRRSA
jgi:hypothetical protein